MRISDWSSDVCSSDLHDFGARAVPAGADRVLSDQNSHPFGVLHTLWLNIRYLIGPKILLRMVPEDVRDRTRRQVWPCLTHDVEITRDIRRIARIEYLHYHQRMDGGGALSLGITVPGRGALLALVASSMVASRVGEEG